MSSVPPPLFFFERCFLSRLALRSSLPPWAFSSAYFQSSHATISMLKGYQRDLGYVVTLGSPVIVAHGPYQVGY
jgi:hypothetical protein